MTTEQIHSTLAQLITQKVDLRVALEQVKLDSRLREDLGMDSLGSLEMLSTISEQLDLHLEIEDAMDIVTFDDACAFVERHMNAGKDGPGARPS